MLILSKTIILLTAISTLLAHQVQSYCSHCIKIEEERTKEQAAHPQPWRYYDDQISLNSKDDSPTQSGGKADKNFSGVGSGALSGSTYRSSTEPDRSSKSLEANNQSTRHFKTQLSANLINADGQARNHNVLAENDEPVGKNREPLSYNNDPNPSSQSYSTYSTIYTIFKTKKFLETLDGSFTLFIPTDEALQQLSTRTLIELTWPENEEKLAALVSNHLVAQKLLRQDFTNNTEVKAISGRNLSLENKNGKLFINNIEILRAEPAGYDGVIYIIDKVLTP
jgi:uncharacterized surface protein with fasciclin (FAS1) repeats